VEDHHASGYGGPSWSWASSLERPDNDIVTADTNAIACPGTDLVEFDDYEICQDRPLAKLSSSNVQLSGDSEFGSVKSASIDLTGLIIPVWLPQLNEFRMQEDDFKRSHDTTYS
jgi:hypothetical protein